VHALCTLALQMVTQLILYALKVPFITKCY